MSADPAAQFAALGDPTRLAIVRVLSRDGPLPTARLRERAGTATRQGLTKHLQALEAAGLLESRRLGRNRNWQLRPGEIAGLRSFLGEMAMTWDRRIERLRALIET